MGKLTVEELLERNKASLASYQPRHLFSEARALGLPKSTTILVTCCDARVQPDEFFGLKPGEVTILRNAGGHVKPLLRELVLLDAAFGHGTVDQLLIVHHTDCGGLYCTNEGLKADIVSRCVWSSVLSAESICSTM